MAAAEEPQSFNCQWQRWFKDLDLGTVVDQAHFIYKWQETTTVTFFYPVEDPENISIGTIPGNGDMPQWSGPDKLRRNLRLEETYLNLVWFRDEKGTTILFSAAFF